MSKTLYSQKAVKNAGRWLLSLLMCGLYLGIIAGSGCNCDGKSDEVEVKNVIIESPTQGLIFNLATDENKNIPSIQISVKVRLELNKEGELPKNVKLRLRTNNKNPIEVTATDLTYIFKDYTLEEGTNSLQVTALQGDKPPIFSDTVVVSADSKCYQIQIVNPKFNAIFGNKDDESAEMPGFQKTVEVQVSPEAFESVELLVTDENEQSTTVRRNPLAGKVSFDQVTLPIGVVKLTAKIQNSSGNECSDQITVTVRSEPPQVEITQPPADKQLCPSDDRDSRQGFQTEIRAKTTAADGSEASLFVDGRKVLGPTLVSAQQVSFELSLSVIQPELFHNIQVVVMDKLGNEGKSVVQNLRIRTRGYDLNFLNIIDGQTIPRTADEDPKIDGVQFTIRGVTSAPDGTNIEMDHDGKKLQAKAQSGFALFTLTLTEEKANCLTMSVVEPICKTATVIGPRCITPGIAGIPSLSCSLRKGPPFDSKRHAGLNKTHDTKADKEGIQNDLLCKTDAEAERNIELVFNGQTLIEVLKEGANKLREAVFADLDFKEGLNTLKVKVTNDGQKSIEYTYTVMLDTTPPDKIIDLKGTVTNHRRASIKLTWTVPKDGEISSSSGIGNYEIRWSNMLTTITVEDWDKPEGKQVVKSSKKIGEMVEVQIDGLTVGTKYVFAVRSRDNSGNLADDISNLADISIDFKSDQAVEAGTGGSSYGTSLAVVGDLDGDGINDLVVCAPTLTVGTQTLVGAAFVYYGRNIASGRYFDTTPDVTILGEGQTNVFCQQVIPMGDLNGDGFADFAVRSRLAAGGKGRVYIFFGSSRGTSLKDGNAGELARVVITGDAGTHFASAIAAAGLRGTPDFNGDKKADLIVSAPNKTHQGSDKKGSVYIFYSRATYPAANEPMLELTPQDAEIEIVNDSEASSSQGTALFGTALTVGDVDRDGNADLFIAASQANSILGFFGPLQPTNKIVLSSQAQFDLQGGAKENGTFSLNLDFVGDVDNDNRPDLMVSSREASIGIYENYGVMRLFSGRKITRGTSLNADTDAEVVWRGERKQSFLQAISPAGDINGDGYADFLIGEGRMKDPNKPKEEDEHGAVYLFYGRPFSNFKSGQSVNSQADVKWYGEKGAIMSYGQSSIAGGVDLTGDGFLDIIMAQQSRGTPPVPGKVFLRY